MATTKSQKNENPEQTAEYSLRQLLHSIVYSTSGQGLSTDIMVSGVTVDSRQLAAGALFVALAGMKTDGHAYLEQVMASKCAAIIVQKNRVPMELLVHCDQCVLVVEDSHLAYAQIAANFYGQPASGLTLVGITGTNGKTTVSYLLDSVLSQRRLAVGVIGTVNYRYHDGQGQTVMLPAPFTTPEPFLLQALLRQMADAGVTHVIMEVSSHALVQRRLGDLLFDVVAFTNLTRDHLDYHQDLDDYFAAKTLLFRDHLKPGGQAVITRSAAYNLEEEQRTLQLLALCGAQGIQVWQCGRKNESDIYPLHIKSGLNGTIMTLHLPEQEAQITSPLVGDFNMENLQTVMAISLALAIEPEVLTSLMTHAFGAPGRLQRIMPAPQEAHFRPAVFVDYAHTPDALEKVLVTLSRLPHRKLICVFGCGGDRDKGKRGLMGAIAGHGSDVLLVTDDNPRSESPQEIVAQIVAGVQRSGIAQRTVAWLNSAAAADQGFLVLHSRAAAISTAIATAAPQDIVLIAGKGHEQYQLGQDGKRFFDDALEAGKALTTWRLASLEQAAGGELIGRIQGAADLRTVVTDSRQVTAGDIFVALAGDKFDGHDFLPQVAAAGAGCLVVRDTTPAESLPALPCLLVQDTQRALGALAAYRRQVMKAVSRPLLVAITGSCGKTTVKEMTAAIFEQYWLSRDDVKPAPERVLKTRGNFNNLIGLPLSLLPINPGHKAVILEMGMNQPGEIARLAEIADPDIACIINVHAVHLEGLHTIEGVAKAKEELFAGCSETTVLVVNLDDPHVRACAEKYQQKKIFFALAAGMDEQNLPQVWASDISQGGNSTQGFILHIAKTAINVTLHIPGLHNVADAVAAAAIAHAAGLGADVIAAGLSVFRATDKRMQIVPGKGGLAILNDTYNANPASMRAALATLCQQAGGRRMAILGDMLELGPGSPGAHREVGCVAAAHGLDYLALIGDFAADTAEGAITAGLDRRQVRIFQDQNDIVGWIEMLLAADELQAGDWLLVKGSRGMRLELVVEQLAGVSS